MAYTIVRGGAIIGLRLCAVCKDNYYQQDLSERPVCQLCNHKIMDGVAVTICRLCSLETCVCQHCGTVIQADDEKLKEKKKRPKKTKEKLDTKKEPDKLSPAKGEATPEAEEKS